jgi:flagellar biosynthesis protein FliR
MGFVMRVVFAGIEMAGEIAGMTMVWGLPPFSTRKPTAAHRRLRSFWC